LEIIVCNIHQFDIEKIIVDEISSAFQKTSFVQPLTYLLSVLTNDMLQEGQPQEIAPTFVLGHSLGAVSALTASGALPFEQGSRVIVARGKYMQEDCENADSGLFAIIGLTEDQVIAVCKKTGVAIALYNAPTAFVVGGRREVFSHVEQEALQYGARKAFALETSGAFHTNFMKGAYEKFRDFFSRYTLQIPRIPVVMNIGCKDSENPQELKHDIIESIVNPIHWKDMMHFIETRLIASAPASYIEVGPGTSLSSLARINGVQKEQITHAKTLLT